MSHNINQFLTSQSGPVYSKIMGILHKFQRTQFDGISPKVYIYGSFVRDLIQHYYNPTKKFNFNNFNNFNKVNVWLDYSPYDHTFESWNSCYKSTFVQLKQELDIKENKSYENRYTDTDTVEPFDSVNVDIDSIKFNFNTKIEINWLEICELTMNNLFIDLFGNIFKRAKCGFLIDQIITHIEQDKNILVFQKCPPESKSHIESYESFIEIKCPIYVLNYDKPMTISTMKYVLASDGADDDVVDYDVDYAGAGADDDVLPYIHQNDD